MDDLFDFEGGSSTYRVFLPQTNIKDELIVRLTAFSCLYSQRRDRLLRVSESFTLTATRLREGAPENKPVRVVFTVFGGALGAACGVVSGGVWGFLGAVSAATFTRICGQIGAVGATVGFLGSVLGGVVGGVFCGAVGGAVGAAAGGSESPLHGVVSDVAWFTIGCATGGSIGGIFGGTVGAAGGAVGGAFGGLYATRFASYLVGSIFGRFSKDSKRQKKKSENMRVIQETAGDFRETIKPLMEEMKAIKSMGEKVDDSDGVRGVAAQMENTLVSVTTLERTLIDSQRASDLSQFVSGVEEAARQSRTITEELKRTREEAQRVLVSLRKP
ncbi:keratin, type I cytoskeletal 10-like [Labrus bergylta]|uniref:keratin, type I cytoskeletal 10-like n=1 Tax=Labrus bergylta TaxID=56723 RepID=UPI00331434BF